MEAPRLRSPPRYPDLCGRRKLQLEVHAMNREIAFIQEELGTLEGVGSVSGCCKEVNDFVGAKPDPLIPLDKKRSRSCGIWSWLRSRLCCCFCCSWTWCCTGEESCCSCRGRESRTDQEDGPCCCCCCFPTFCSCFRRCSCRRCRCRLSCCWRPSCPRFRCSVAAPTCFGGAGPSYCLPAAWRECVWRRICCCCIPSGGLSCCPKYSCGCVMSCPKFPGACIVCPQCSTSRTTCCISGCQC